MQPSLFVEHVVYHATVDVAVEQVVRLLDHQVAPFQSLLVGIGGELVHQILLLEIVFHFHHLLEVVQFQSIVVRIREGKLQNQSAHAGLLIIRGVVRGVFRHEEVWRNTASTIYGTPVGGMVCRSGMFDRVFREELPMLITA